MRAKEKNTGMRREEHSPQKEIMEGRKKTKAHPLTKEVKKERRAQPAKKKGAAGRSSASVTERVKRSMPEHKMLDASGQDKRK